jgi:uncharacterized membrane protein
LLIGICFLAAWPRFAGLGAKSLWMDEALSWRLQSLPISLMIARTGEPTTVHPPFFFGLLHFWTLAFGDSEFALRSLAATAGVLAVAGLYQLVRELVIVERADSARGEFAAILTAMLFAVSPFQIQQARQTRGYSLALLLFLVSAICMLRALRRPAQSKKWWAGYAISALACCYTHNLALFSVAAQGLFWLMLPLFQQRADPTDGPIEEMTLLDGRDHAGTSRWFAVAAFLAIIVGYAPWVPNLWAQSETLRTSWTTVRTWNGRAREVYTALLSITEVQIPVSDSAAWGILVVLVGAIAYVVFRFRTIGLFVVLTGVLPALLIICYSFFSIRNIFQARYLAFAQPVWLISLAFIAAAFRDRIERLGAATILVLWSTHAVYSLGQFSQPDALRETNSIRDFIISRRAPDEPIIALTPFEFFKLRYIFRDGPVPRLAAPTHDRHALRGAALLFDDELMTPDEITKSSTSGLWLVTSRSYLGSAETVVSFPPEWQVEKKDFPQEYYWEHPVRVTHIRRK